MAGNDLDGIPVRMHTFNGSAGEVNINNVCHRDSEKSAPAKIEVLRRAPLTFLS